jgi:hypothetical protein
MVGTNSKWSLVVGFYEHIKKISGSIKGGLILLC